MVSITLITISLIYVCVGSLFFNFNQISLPMQTHKKHDIRKITKLIIHPNIK